jgi:hypothetical protein
LSNFIKYNKNKMSIETASSKEQKNEKQEIKAINPV